MQIVKDAAVSNGFILRRALLHGESVPLRLATFAGFSSSMKAVWPGSKPQTLSSASACPCLILVTGGSFLLSQLLQGKYDIKVLPLFIVN